MLDRRRAGPQVVLRHGDTPAEALAEAEIAIELWIETALECNLIVPEPRYRPAIYAAA